MKYKRVIAKEAGGPEVLRVKEEEIRSPGPGEIRVRVLAAGISFADVLVREGVYPGMGKFPITPGYDIVGTVEETGEDATSVQRGDRVAALMVTGGYAESVTISADRAVRVPEGVDPAEAVSLVLNYATAYQMLHRASELRKGDTILVHGASGGVGTALLQLGQSMGLRLLATASPKKHDLIRSFGAIPVDYTRPGMETALRALAPEGVAAAYDGTGRWVFPSYRLLRPGGRLILFGLSSMLEKGRKNFFKKMGALLRMTILLRNLLPGNRKIIFYQITGYLRKEPRWYGEDLAALFQLLEKGTIRPLIFSRHSLDEVAECHKRINKGEVMGKMVLVFRDA